MNMSNEEILKAQAEAIIKFESGAKSYRQKYRPIPTQIKCYKCGSTQHIMSLGEVEGQKYYACRNCVRDRMSELDVKDNIKKD